MFGLRRPASTPGAASGDPPPPLRGPSPEGANTPAARVALRATCLPAPGELCAIDAGALVIPVINTRWSYESARFQD